jgi:hypothetical protein
VAAYLYLGTGVTFRFDGGPPQTGFVCPGDNGVVVHLPGLGPPFRFDGTGGTPSPNCLFAPWLALLH